MLYEELQGQIMAQSGSEMLTVRLPGETATMRLNYQDERNTSDAFAVALQMTPDGCYLNITEFSKASGGGRILLPETFLHLPIDQFLDEIDSILAKSIFDPLDRTQVDKDALRVFLDTPMQQTGKPRTAFFQDGTLVFEAVIENGVVTEYTGPGGVVKVPDGVTAIGDRAFEGCSRLTGIVLPEGVTDIGVSAFRNCTCLKSVILPQSLKRIGKYAFMGCRELQCPEVRDGVEVGKMAFSGTIPNN